MPGCRVIKLSLLGSMVFCLMCPRETNFSLACDLIHWKFTLLAREQQETRAAGCKTAALPSGHLLPAHRGSCTELAALHVYNSGFRFIFIPRYLSKKNPEPQWRKLNSHRFWNSSLSDRDLLTVDTLSRCSQTWWKVSDKRQPQNILELKSWQKSNCVRLLGQQFNNIQSYTHSLMGIPKVLQSQLVVEKRKKKIHI